MKKHLVQGSLNRGEKPLTSGGVSTIGEKAQGCFRLTSGEVCTFSPAAYQGSINLK